MTAFARKPKLAVWLVGCCAFSLRLLILPWSPVPAPFLLPDFSFLLAADTFASGRLVNPTPPLWTHFESFHITLAPSYMSMYFPAQGLVMAAGVKLVGSPWFGVLLSTALMCAALTWMLQAWLPPKWALLGGFLAVLRLGLFSYWIDTYAGGSVAALGGALVLGAMPRIWRRFRSWDCLWFALGVAILAISRPFEGILLCVPAMLILFWKGRKSPHPGLPELLRRTSPALLLLASTAVFMAYYDYRVFGSVFTPPYKVNRELYAMAPHFLWQSARPAPLYRHPLMRDFYSSFELKEFLRAHTPGGFLFSVFLKMVTVQCFFFGAILLIPLVMLPLALRDKRTRILVVIGAVAALGLVSETFMLPHYVAPFTGIFYALLVQCMRHMRAWRLNGRAAGVFLVRAIPAVCVLLCIVRLYAEPLHIGLAPARFTSRAWYGTPAFGQERERVKAALERQPGKQLAIVVYAPDHDLSQEWIGNAAEMGTQKVIWARSMTPEQDAELVHAFPNRTAWLIEPDSVPPRLSRYQLLTRSKLETVSNVTSQSQ